MKYCLVVLISIVSSLQLSAQLKAVYPTENTTALYDKVNKCIVFRPALNSSTNAYIPSAEFSAFNGICSTADYRILQYVLFYYDGTGSTRNAVEDVVTDWNLLNKDRHKNFNKAYAFFLDHIIAINAKGDTVLLSGAKCKVVKP